MEGQHPCDNGIWCCLYGEGGCKKWVQSVWAYKQHLCTKHMLSPKESSLLAEKQWKELEALVGKVPKPPARGRVELKPKPDLRRPNVPAEPPSWLKDEDTPPSNRDVEMCSST